MLLVLASVEEGEGARQTPLDNQYEGGGWQMQVHDGSLDDALICGVISHSIA